MHPTRRSFSPPSSSRTPSGEGPATLPPVPQPLPASPRVAGPTEPAPGPIPPDPTLLGHGPRTVLHDPSEPVWRTVFTAPSGVRYTRTPDRVLRERMGVSRPIDLPRADSRVTEANDRRIESLKAQLVPGPAPFGGKPVLPPSQLARGPFTAPPQSRMARPATEIEPTCLPDEPAEPVSPPGSGASVELQETVSQELLSQEPVSLVPVSPVPVSQEPCPEPGPKSPCPKSLCLESRPRRRSMLKVRCPLPPIRRST